MNESYKKRIAKNAIFLYARKGFSILVGLYTSRLLLERLGFDDFGLYGVVGSVVVMFNALRYIFSDSIQRYINIAKGEQNNSKIAEIFSIGINIHILLSIIFIIVVEIGGFFILPHLNTGHAPNWVIQIIFQASLFSAIVTLMTVPYDALIIANEHFKAYAVFSIIDVILRLVLVIALVLFTSWRVVWYAVFTFAILLFIRSINAYYCKKHFHEESAYTMVRNKALTLEIAKFAGWNFIGNLGYWLTFSGLDLVLNHFGGLVINAARNIANQVFYNFQQFIGDLNTSFRPRSMMLYSNGEIKSYYNLMFLNTKTNFFICSVLCFIFILFTPEILKIWLSNVPEDTTIFCQIILLYSLIRSLRGPIDIYYKTIGQLKYYQVIECVLTVLNLPFSYLALKNGFPLYSVFIIMAGIETVNYITMVILASAKFGFKGYIFFKDVLYRIIIGLVLGYALFYILYYLKNQTNSIVVISILLLISIVVISSLELFVLFNYSERAKLYSLAAKFFRKR